MKYNLILASNSPRRRELLKGLDLDFQVKTLPGVDEVYPPELPATEVAEYLATLKAGFYLPDLQENELLITADTIVCLDGEIFGKPLDKADAKRMLQALSGRTHQVMTGVCLMTQNKKTSFTSLSDVTFAELEEAEIDYYLSTYRPYDKAGAYGVQEWIGYVAVKHISGSYYNVMGLPIHRLYEELKQF
ncbi:MAG: Maf-like protein [Prevotellaceae bacterium]|nr:Maf-like protein [Prevotellaceae bacterium]